MIQREDSIVELIDRVKAGNLGIAYLKRTPTAMPSSGQYPALFVLEGMDKIVDPGKRNWSGYPCRRRLEATFELWTPEDPKDETQKIKTLFDSMRGVLFGAPLNTGAAMAEDRSVGPFNGGIPGIVCMQLVIAINYKDDGPTI